MAITSAFQADDAGSIPAARSSFEWALLFAKLLCKKTDLRVQRSSKSTPLKILASMGGLLDGVPLNNKTLVIKAAHLRGLFCIQAHGNQLLRALLINPAREACPLHQ
ncbi:TPA: hypothetical protein H2W85_003211 [Salmonella enterica]|nr:hypothetical protein [Salmonella enterica]